MISTQRAAESFASASSRTAAADASEPIDASALALANGEMAFSADSIDLGDLKLGRTRTLMTLDQSRAVFALRDLLTDAREARSSIEYVRRASSTSGAFKNWASGYISSCPMGSS